MFSSSSDESLCKKPLPYDDDVSYERTQSLCLPNAGSDVGAHGAISDLLDFLDCQCVSEISNRNRAILQLLAMACSGYRGQVTRSCPSLSSTSAWNSPDPVVADEMRPINVVLDNNGHAPVKASYSCPGRYSSRTDIAVITDEGCVNFPREFAPHFKHRPYTFGWAYIYYPRSKRIEIMIKQKGTAPLSVIEGIHSKLSIKVTLNNGRNKTLTLCTSKDSKLPCKIVRFKCSLGDRLDEVPLKLSLFAHKNLLQKKCVATVSAHLGTTGQTYWVEVGELTSQHSCFRVARPSHSC